MRAGTHTFTPDPSFPIRQSMLLLTIVHKRKEVFEMKTSVERKTRLEPASRRACRACLLPLPASLWEEWRVARPSFPIRDQVQNGVFHHDFTTAIIIWVNELIINGYLQNKMAGTKQGFIAISLWRPSNGVFLLFPEKADFEPAIGKLSCFYKTSILHAPEGVFLKYEQFVYGQVSLKVVDLAISFL